MLAVAKRDIEETIILLRLIQSHAEDRETQMLAGRLADMWRGQLSPDKIVLA